MVAECWRRWNHQIVELSAGMYCFDGADIYLVMHGRRNNGMPQNSLIRPTFLITPEGMCEHTQGVTSSLSISHTVSMWTRNLLNSVTK